MFDIEFQLAVSLKDHYLQRLLDFKKYGLVNLGKKKIILKLLVGGEKLPKEVVEDWPYEVRIIPNDSRHPTALLPKLYNYYPNMSEEVINESRWFSKLDDDSITDVSGLVDSLDRDYDFERDYYLVTVFGPEADEHHIDNHLAASCGYGRWFSWGPEHLPEHEIEMCVISQSCMRRMVTNETSRSFMLRRGQITGGFGDVALAYAARMCKVYPTVAPFITEAPRIRDFSMLGGKINHIHWVGRDINKKLYSFLTKVVTNKVHTEKEWNLVKDKEYLVCNQKATIDKVTFLKNGLIDKSEFYHFWFTNGGKFMIFDYEARTGDALTPTGKILNGNKVVLKVKNEIGLI